MAQRPPTDRHVPELASYLDRVQIAEPIVYRHLAVYPVLLEDGPRLGGRWLTLDQALSRGVLVIREKGSGSVPLVVVENRSPDQYVFIMHGEVISGGKQTRTVRQDVIVAPGQRIELNVFCVEARRWQGSSTFSTGGVLLPQSIQLELRAGANQGRVWDEVARNNAALRAENPSGSLEVALNSPAVRERLAEVRGAIEPKVPQGAMGFIFVSHGRALGAELFGSQQFARDLFPKLLDSYAVDYVLIAREGHFPWRPDNRAAIELFERICRAGSHYSHTPGSGSGIRTRADRLLGDGVSLDRTLVHYGVQVEARVVPPPRPRPPIIYPDQGGR